MLFHTLYIMWSKHLQTCNHLGRNVVTRKYSIWTWLCYQGHLKHCPAPSTSCDVCNCKVWSCYVQQLWVDESNTVFDPGVGVTWNFAQCMPISSVYSFEISCVLCTCFWSCRVQRFWRRCVFKKIHNLTFDLGPTKCCPVSFIQLQRLKLLRLMVQEEMLLHKNTLFDLCQWPRSVAQYPLHHLAYAATKFKVAAVNKVCNGLGGDTLQKPHARTSRTRMSIQTPAN